MPSACTLPVLPFLTFHPCFLACQCVQEKQEEAARRGDLGEPWVEALQTASYDGLSLEDRVGMLCSLCHLVLDCPSIK